eukprot:g3647.t1
MSEEKISDSDSVIAEKRERKRLMRIREKRHKITEALERRVFEFEKNIEEKKAGLVETEHKLAKCDFMLLEHARIGGPDSGTWKSDQHRLAMLRRLRTIEKNVEIAQNTRNRVIGKQIIKKQEIDDLRTDKCVFTKAFRRMQEGLDDLETKALQENATVETIYSFRDKAQILVQGVLNEFQKRKDRLASDLNKLKEREEALAEEERKEKEEEAQKQKEYDFDKLGRNKRSATKSRSKTAQSKTDKLSLKSKMMGLSFNQNSEGHGKNSKVFKIHEIGYYNELWNKIKERTGLHNIDDLCNVFVQLEQIKMKKILEANNIISDLKAMISDTEEMKKEREAIVRQKNKDSVRQKNLIYNLRQKVEKVEREVNESQIQVQRALSLINMLSGPMQTLRNNIICAPNMPKELDEAISIPDYSTSLNCFSEMPSPIIELEAEVRDNPSCILKPLSEVEHRAAEIIQFSLASQIELQQQRERRRARNMGKKEYTEHHFPSLRFAGPQYKSGTLNRMIHTKGKHITQELDRRYLKSRKQKNRDEFSLYYDRGAEKPLFEKEIKSMVWADFSPSKEKDNEEFIRYQRPSSKRGKDERFSTF